MNNNRVIWSEGLFLRPQHFQQMERSIETLVGLRTSGATAHAWGFTRLQIDGEALKTGHVSITQAAGILPDGTPFAIPDESPAPPSLEVARDLKQAVVRLALPARRSGMPEFAIDPGPAAALARYLAVERAVEDSVLGMNEAADMQVGQLNLR